MHFAHTLTTLVSLASIACAARFHAGARPAHLLAVVPPTIPDSYEPVLDFQDSIQSSPHRARKLSNHLLASGNPDNRCGGNRGFCCSAGNTYVTDSLCCPTGYNPNAEKTTCCPSGWTFRDGTCWQDSGSNGNSCPSGWTLQNGSCVIDGAKDGQCGGSRGFCCNAGNYYVSDTLCCPNGSTFRDGTCWGDKKVTVSCPSGWTLKNGHCEVDGATQGQCGGSRGFCCDAGNFYVSDTLCCPTGYTPNEAKTACWPNGSGDNGKGDNGGNAKGQCGGSRGYCCVAGQFYVSDNLCCPNGWTVNDQKTACYQKNPDQGGNGGAGKDGNGKDLCGGSRGFCCPSGSYYVSDSLCCPTGYTPNAEKTTCWPN
ncbi:hypothetical protein BC830DRAFT_1162721 [Chytriomyces sp. MP71]|nr:hypothetical protein BC830DRAFT_1162721 [Chytriomyces sp. MP71]